MGKLFKLKKWVTVPVAAKHLSQLFEEEVTEADVLRLALDGNLQLSIHLVNGAFARPCVPVEFEKISWNEVPSLDGRSTIRIPIGGRIFQNKRGLFQIFETVTELEEAVWNLPLTDGERLDVEHRYQQLIDGPAVTTISLEGILVESENGRLFEVQTYLKDERQRDEDSVPKSFFHPDNFHPAGCLPKDGTFVVRTSALRDFELSVNDSATDIEKPLTNRERSTLLTIIAALCKMATLDYGRPAKTAGIIQNTAATMGLSIGESTIEGHLKKIPDAIGTRMK